MSRPFVGAADILTLSSSMAAYRSPCVQSVPGAKVTVHRTVSDSSLYRSACDAHVPALATELNAHATTSASMATGLIVPKNPGAWTFSAAAPQASVGFAASQVPAMHNHVPIGAPRVSPSAPI